MSNGRKKRRRPWTPTEVGKLRRASRDHTPAFKVARKLKRTEGATRQKAFSLGLSLDSRAAA